MKFIASSSALLKQIQQVGGVISSNSVLPILEDFLFLIGQNQLTIIATDLETTMRVSFEVESREEGRVCIPARILLDTLKNLPDQPLTLDINNDSFAVEITSDSGKYKVMGENPDNFPKEPVSDESSSFTMPSGALVTGINKTLFAVSNDDLRPAMNGLLFELDPKQLSLVATDAHRLVKYTRKDVNCPRSESFIVPKKPLNILKSVLPDDDSILNLAYNANHLFVTLGKLQMVCRLIDARFPDYKVVIPTDNPYRLKLNRSDFQHALRRVSVFSNKSTNLVALQISGSELQMSSQDLDFSFEGNERMNCQYQGEDMAIGFNARFLIDLMGAVDGEEVVLELSVPNRAGVIRPVDKTPDEELLMLILPLMLGNNANQ